ncbi:MAG: hypothetical protein PVH63_01620 [Balneolaceae bacterium]|jgi:hypothetical protein
MQEFIQKAQNKNEVMELSPEIFWAIAFGPFYALAKFYLDKGDTLGRKYSLDENKLKEAFDLVIKALKP